MRTQTLAFAIATALTAAATPAFAANGDLDTSFGQGGLRSIAFDVGGSKTDVPTALVRMPDGSYVVAGRASTAANTTDAVAAKLTPAGNVDFGFATLGKYRQLFPAEQDEDQGFSGAVALPDGRPVLVGFYNHANSGGGHTKNTLLARLSDSGVQQNLSYGAGEQFPKEFNAAALDKNGKVVCAGYIANAGFVNPNVFSRRYLPAFDSYDGGYGASGDLEVPIDLGNTPGIDVATAVVSLPDGSTLMGGYTQIAGADYDFALVHADPSGNLDFVDFGFDTIAFDQAGSSKTDRIRAMTIDPQGRILIAGEVARSADGFDTDVAIVRLKPDLGIDTTFGAGGKLVLSYDILGPDAKDEVGGIAVAPDGKILIVGTHRVGAADNTSDVALVRLKDNGDSDLTFGVFGRELYDFGLGASRVDRGVGLVVESDRVVVLSQREYNGADTDFLVFAVQSNQIVKPDAVFKDGYE